MKQLLQWIKTAINRFVPQASQMNKSGVLAGAVVFAATMTLVDTVLLVDEDSLFHGISLALTSIVKVGIAATFAGIVASLYPVRTDTLPTTQPSELYTRAARYLLGSSVLILVFGNLLSNVVEADRSEDVLRLFIACLASLVGVTAIARQFQWLDVVIAIRRTEMTGKFRSASVILGVLLVFTEVLSAIIGFDAEGVATTLHLMTGAFLFVTILRLPWLATFSKDQKWRALGFAAATMAVNTTTVAVAANDPAVMKSFELLLPGLRNLTTLAGVLSAIFFGRVSLSIVLALPTATVMDRKINEVRSLAYLSRTISQVYDLERLLGIVTTMIQDVCGATSAWIELKDNEGGLPSSGGKVRIAGQMQISPQQLQLLYKDGILRSIIDGQGDDNPQSLYFEALEEERAFAAVYPYTTGFAQSLIAVPLMLDGKRIGTVFAAHRDKFAFEFEDISLLSAFANNISIAIENARLFENSLEQERYKREMMLARQMQQKLLPKELPQFERFDVAAYASPALEVGGDYYDAVKLKDGTPCLVVGDVSGKGITAAFYMAELKGVVLAVAQESSSPKELLCRLNATLLGNMERGSYITMTAVALDEPHSELVVARAGHTPIAVFDAAADYVQLLTPKGFGVAIVGSALFESSLEETRIPMSQRSMCLVYTDGINEAMNATDDEFGYEPLCEVLQTYRAEEAQFLVGEVVRRVVQFSGDAPQHDDMTIIGIVARSDSVQHAKEMATEQTHQHRHLLEAVENNAS